MPAFDDMTDEERQKYQAPTSNPPVRTTATHKIYNCIANLADWDGCLDEFKVKKGQRGRPPLYCRPCKAEIDRRKFEVQGPHAHGSRANGLPAGPATPEDRARKDMEICGAERSGKSASGPGICCMPRGWGTDHPGVGNCKHHTGNTPSGKLAAVKEQMHRETALLGNPIVIDPHSAVLQEIHRTAGHVEWLRVSIASMGVNPEDRQQAAVIREETGMEPKGIDILRQFTDKGGIEISVWMQLYQDERKHLVNSCKAAVQMGCAERTVQLAEDQGRLIAMVIKKVLDAPELAMTNAQKAHIPVVVRRELQSIETTAREIEQLPVRA